MTEKDSLFHYRLAQAEETLQEAEKMLKESFSPRSVVNRAYYAMFYMLLALFIRTGVNVKTSKHIGIISLFDKEFVKTGKMDKRFSAMLHNTFDLRQESDYKEFIEISANDAKEVVVHVKDFLIAIKNFMAEGL